MPQVFKASLSFSVGSAEAKLSESLDLPDDFKEMYVAYR